MRVFVGVRVVPYRHVKAKEAGKENGGVVWERGWERACQYGFDPFAVFFCFFLFFFVVVVCRVHGEALCVPPHWRAAGVHWV